MKKSNTYLFIIVIIISAFVSILYSDKKKIFPHNTHIENDVECKTCHTKTETSKSEKDNNFPDNYGICSEECHEGDMREELDLQYSQPQYKLKFNHEVHIEQDLKCTKCHKGLESSNFKPGSAFPEMKVCFECHNNDDAPKTCTLCHLEKMPFPHPVHLENDVECESCHKEIPSSSKTKRGKDIPQKGICAEECHEASEKGAEVILFDAVKQAKNLVVVFNHQVHIEQDLKCTKCHKGLDKKDAKPGDFFPKMKICFECHNNDDAPKTCTLCHKVKVEFPHKLHLENDLECDGCHTNIKNSTFTTGAPDIPPKKICNECHEAEDKFPDVVVFPYRQTYRFNHQEHVVNQELDCKDCHKVLYEKEKPKKTELVPKMEYCFECHDNETATQYCMLCHLNPTKPKDHYYDWDNFHRKNANRDLKNCIGCHQSKNFCISCHKGIKKPAKTHNSNFEVTHKYEARTSIKNCYACHTTRQCRNCHISQSVSYKSATKYKKIHPSGWVDKTSPNFHKRKARLRLKACVACHTKKDCYGCHNPSGVGPRR